MPTKVRFKQLRRYQFESRRMYIWKLIASCQNYLTIWTIKSLCRVCIKYRRNCNLIQYKYELIWCSIDKLFYHPKPNPFTIEYEEENNKNREIAIGQAQQTYKGIFCLVLSSLGLHFFSWFLSYENLIDDI